MQISRFPMNNSKDPHWENSMEDKHAGFTILECILAVGVLALAIASIVGLQSSIVSSTRIAVNKMQASWAIRSAMEQVQYILDVQGQAFVPESVTFPWQGDTNFSTTVSRKDLNDIKPSQFLLSAMKVSNAMDPSANQNEDLDKIMAPIAAMMDNSVGTLRPKAKNGGASAPTSAQSYFCNIVVSTNWSEGNTPQTLSEGLFLIDNDVLSNFKPPAPQKSDSSSSDNPSSGPKP